MRITYELNAYGHPNIRSTHKTTLMTTTEPILTTRGNCIIAVATDTGLFQLPKEIKKAARDAKTKITFRLQTGSHFFETHGKGHPELTYTDSIDMVARKSNYTCGRTLMISADKTAQDIPVTLIEALQSSKTKISIMLIYEK